MPQLDAHHHIVRKALENDGWTITDDPLVIEYKDLTLYADLGAEQTLGAEKAGQRIAVEIKVFGSLSITSELQKAKGQYDLYEFCLRRTEPERKLYLAIAESVWNSYFQRPSIQDFINEQALSLLIFDVNTAEVVQWIR